MINTLRYLAIFEGISYLLFAITMPLKRVYEMPEPNFYVGIIHGVLFILYCLFVLLCAYNFKWKMKKTLVLGFASLIPFGTFWAEKKYLREN